MRIPHNLVFTTCRAAILVGQGEIKNQLYCGRSIVALLITALMFIPGAYGGGVSMEGGTTIEASGSAQGYSVADDSGTISERSSDGMTESF